MEKNALCFGLTNSTSQNCNQCPQHFVSNDCHNTKAAPMSLLSSNLSLESHLQPQHPNSYNDAIPNITFSSHSTSSVSQDRRFVQNENSTDSSNEGSFTPPRRSSLPNSPQQNRRVRKRKIPLHLFSRKEDSTVRSPSTSRHFSSGEFPRSRESRGRQHRLLSVSLPNFPFERWSSVNFEVMLRTFSSQLRFTVPNTIELSPDPCPSVSTPFSPTTPPSNSSSSTLSSPTGTNSRIHTNSFSAQQQQQQQQLPMSIDSFSTAESSCCYPHDELFGSDILSFQSLLPHPNMHDEFSLSTTNDSEFPQNFSCLPVETRRCGNTPTSEDSDTMVGTLSSGVVSSDESGTASPEHRPSPGNFVVGVMTTTPTPTPTSLHPGFYMHNDTFS